MSVERCEVTGNPYGTDTWTEGQPCRCSNCQRMLEHERTRLQNMVSELISAYLWMFERLNATQIRIRELEAKITEGKEKS
jgi:hypothetical protein